MLRFFKNEFSNTSIHLKFNTSVQSGPPAGARDILLVAAALPPEKLPGDASEIGKITLQKFI